MEARERTWWGPRLATMLAVLVMVGAWSAAQQREVEVPIVSNADGSEVPLYIVTSVPGSKELPLSEYQYVDGDGYLGRTVVCGTMAGMGFVGGILHYQYGWPVAGAGWNLAVGAVLVLGAGVVVESLVRRRGRVALWELLLGVSVAAVMLAVGRSFWGATGLAEVGVVARAVLVAGSFCAVLAMVWMAVAVVRWSRAVIGAR